jgi:hypothetical protein
MKTIINKTIISLILTFVLINGKSFATNFSEIKANETNNLSQLSVNDNLVKNSSINKLEINNEMNSLNNLDINEIDKIYSNSESNETKLHLLTQNLIETNHYINETNNETKNETNSQININNTIVNNNESKVNCTPITITTNNNTNNNINNNTNNEVTLLPLNRF